MGFHPDRAIWCPDSPVKTWWDPAWGMAIMALSAEDILSCDICWDLQHQISCRSKSVFELCILSLTPVDVDVALLASTVCRSIPWW